MGKKERLQLTAILKEASDLFRACAKKLKILGSISWDASVAEEFFKKKQLPRPLYKIDKEALSEVVESLKNLAPKLRGDHPVLEWLRKSQESLLLGAQLLLEVETENFYKISCQLYGSPESRPFDAAVSNLDLAKSISSRMSVCNVNDIAESEVLKSAEGFSQDLERRLKARTPAIPVKVELSGEIVAKVVAGMHRVRIRKDARFSELDVSALWNHEIESHCLTAHNGHHQENCEFLASGGPRSTQAQEGLAVFFELYGHSMSQRRFIALCDRVHAVELVEQGANFIDLFNWYLVRTDNPMEAFYAAQRIFRGADVTGRFPFTKDVVYIAGLVGIYNFLRVAVKNQNRILVESLVCGRIALEDVPTIAWLRTHGILSPPKYVPEWLKNWESLLSFFVFSGFIGNVDVASVQKFFDEQSTLQAWDFSL